MEKTSRKMWIFAEVCLLGLRASQGSPWGAAACAAAVVAAARRRPLAHTLALGFAMILDAHETLAFVLSVACACVYLLGFTINGL
jgi:hypothetical protein